MLNIYYFNKFKLKDIYIICYDSITKILNRYFAIKLYKFCKINYKKELTIRKNILFILI